MKVLFWIMFSLAMLSTLRSIQLVVDPKSHTYQEVKLYQSSPLAEAFTSFLVAVVCYGLTIILWVISKK